MTKREFIDHAAGQGVTFRLVHDGKLADVPVTAKPVLTRLGSCGFAWQGALYVKVGDEWVNCLASVRLTVVGSKKWPADIAPPVPPV